MEEVTNERARVKKTFQRAIDILGQERVSRLLKRIEYEVGPHGYGSTKGTLEPRVDFSGDYERKLLQPYIDFIAANRRIAYRKVQEQVLNDNPFA